MASVHDVHHQVLCRFSLSIICRPWLSPTAVHVRATCRTKNPHGLGQIAGQIRASDRNSQSKRMGHASHAIRAALCSKHLQRRAEGEGQPLAGLPGPETAVFGG